jgi:hypothetical protein
VNMAVLITTKPEHPINRHLNKKKTYDQSGLRPRLITPFFVRAKKTCSMLEVDLKDLDQKVQPENTPWITNVDHNARSSQGIEHTQNKSQVGRNPKRKLPGLHPNIHEKIKNQKGRREEGAQ